MPQPQVPAELKYKRARKILQDSQTMESPSSDPSPAAVGSARPLRLRRVKRDEVTHIPARLEALLPEDHPSTGSGQAWRA